MKSMSDFSSHKTLQRVLNIVVDLLVIQDNIELVHNVKDNTRVSHAHDTHTYTYLHSEREKKNR